MLDKNSLTQLKQLKQQIEDNKEYADGTVKGTQRKFGFVVLEDGREIYLSPDEMQKVFPDDRVNILIVTEAAKKPDANAKISGSIQKILSSPLDTFTGRYIVKGQGHFVEPDLPRLSRWIFIPPKARKGAKPGDFIRCKISKHPFPSTKPQAKILEVIGSPDQVGIEANYITSKFQLAPQWPEDWQQTLIEPDLTARTDLTEQPFVTIDAASTQDMDDALYATRNDQGWELQVAIADPGSFIPEDSPADNIASKTATSTYLPGKVIAMLPNQLATQLCSLLPDELRPALVCRMQISTDGDIQSFSIFEATIKSQAKLSYRDVSDFLKGKLQDKESGNDLSACEAHRENLEALQAVSEALIRHRQKHHIVIDSRQDYQLILNEQKKLDRIVLQQKTNAHHMVEECMIAANRCAADQLGEKGLFIQHNGFRPERLPDVKKLAEEQLNLTDIDFSTPEGYQQLIDAIDDDNLEFPLRAVLSRLHERSQLSLEAAPHYGMGLTSYTTFTSPIRKYSDLLVHRIIKAAGSDSPSKLTQSTLDQLQESQDNSRQACYQLEQWLKCQYLQPMIGQTHTGRVTQLNSNGFTVRLDEHLIEGFVETKQLKEKFSFDPMRLRLNSQSQRIELEQAVTVVIKEVDSAKRSIRFALAEKSTPSKQQTEQHTEPVN